MTILVTGGAGFIGSHVVDKLRERSYEVRIFDLVTPFFRDDIVFHQGSLLDFDVLQTAMEDIEIVFHLGAVADVNTVFALPRYAEEVNVRGTINVLEAARTSKSVQRVIYGSTIWVYSDTKAPSVDESTPLYPPAHLYTATKLTGEYYCHTYSKLYGLDCTILRYGIPYGPRARDSAVIPVFVHKALRGEPITIAGDGSQSRKFVYVADLAEASALATAPVAANKTYNCVGTERVTITQVAELIRQLIGHEVAIEYVPARPGDYTGSEISGQLVKQELGWEPSTRFRDGLERYIAWYREREQVC